MSINERITTRHLGRVLKTLYNKVYKNNNPYIRVEQQKNTFYAKLTPNVMTKPRDCHVGCFAALSARIKRGKVLGMAKC
jgi:hypothetical protein